jgi:acetylornithine/N-succinyldiaminopimelate aminotransferase
MPIGAMLCREALAEALPAGSHGSTFGGNPLASAAALCVLETVDREGLMDGAVQKGLHLEQRLRALAERHGRIVEATRGLGLLQALLIREGIDARTVVAKLRDAGLLVTVAGSRGIRFSPPLTVTTAELDEGAEITDRVLATC